VTGTDSPTAFTFSAEALDNFRRYIGDANATVFGGGNGDLNQSPAGTFATGDRPIVNGTLILVMPLTSPPSSRPTCGWQRTFGLPRHRNFS
jgi:hypothetical protein